MPEHQLTRLRSGERVISEEMPGVRSASLGLWIGVGSRDEAPSRAGVSHFIEHLLFKGSARFDAVEIAEAFDVMGGELNAATSRETTVLYTRVSDVHVQRALDVMCDMVFAPSFADVDHERDVVLEEIAMVDDNPHDLVHDLAAQALFGQHPLGRPVIGRAEVISTVSPRALRAFHAAGYAGSKVVLAAAGSVDHGELVAQFRKRSRAVRRVSGLRRRLLHRAPRPGLVFHERDTEQYHACLAAPGISHDDPRRYAAALLDSILGGSASSRLFQEIREKRGMAYAVYSYGSQYQEAGQIGLYVGTREENLADCLDVIGHELTDIAAGNLRDGELERARENNKGRLLLSLESTAARMSRLGRALVTGSELVSVDETIARLDAVREQDVASLAAELLAPPRLAAAGIGPSEKRFVEAVARVNPRLVPVPA